MYKILGVWQLSASFCPASAFVTADSDEARNPQHFIHVTVIGNTKQGNSEKTLYLYHK